MKYKVLIDIKSRVKNLRNISNCVNLNRVRVIRIPLKSLISIFLTLSFIGFFVFNLVIAPTNFGAKAASTPAEERAALEAQLAEIEKEISGYESTIEDYKKQGKTLSSEIKSLNDKISKANLQIKSITLTLSKVNTQLKDTESEIKTTQEEIDGKKTNIADIIQVIYENEKRGTVVILLANLKISDLFVKMSNLASIQDQLSGNLKELFNLQAELANKKEDLALQKTDAENLKAYQERQRLAIQKTQTEKNTILKATKGKESEYQKILTDSKKTAAQIRNRLFELLGGGQMTFEDAYKMAQFASEKTGIRAAIILAVLDKESALGQNVGRCRYDENPYYPARASNKTAMHPTRDIPIFLDIIKTLDLNPVTTLVSCPIPSDGAYGGAMGPAQFIPSTWALYETKITSLTGNSPASPWRNLDAFMATGLYLKDAYNSSSCVQYGKEIPSQSQMLRERCAAAKYYAGSRWYTYRWAYGEPVIIRANQFQQDIATLNA